ncbi:Protein CBR-XBX-3 [Caenorhabditis briggsae]|uniref:Protein CBR-XBX-3 n=2 Tax=Caenorhabditis briggsae TaxID=6238 RepID=A0AAE9DE11_CAEBR|nr:Protein CBR-XBX-3 [Caenorhabditis briggsae]ULU01729.1 hypothetical protein L3Y34_001787 [Caenorhabditis briggsae]UMM24360.1 hypothetical protein L5515_004627 [Caenorhabditis briggsae]CAP29446.1 Protein CBR-XBX-3 [Caenorhabditis briggsae]
MENPTAEDIIIQKETESVAAKMELVSNHKRFLWACNLIVEVGIMMYHGMLLRIVPKYYPFMRNQFWISIGFALLNILVTLKMKKCLQGFQASVSFLHLLWILYGFATIPVFITAITEPIAVCNHAIHSCAMVKMGAFEIKLAMGIVAQAAFVISIFGELKRLAVLIQFPYVASTELSHMDLAEQDTASVSEENGFRELSADQLEKNPNDIVIVA